MITIPISLLCTLDLQQIAIDCTNNCLTPTDALVRVTKRKIELILDKYGLFLKTVVELDEGRLIVRFYREGEEVKLEYQEAEEKGEVH